MTYFADLDAEGRVLGFYTPEIHGDAIPEWAVEISDQIHVAWLADTARQRWNGEALEPCDPPPPPPPPPPSVPREISLFQARALLMNMPGSAPGRTFFQDVDDALRALGGVELQAWEYVAVIPRNSALVAALAAQFNLTEAALDDMFLAAAQISI
jgi:hypothetical protein